MNTKLNHIQNWPELAQQAKWRVNALAKLCDVSALSLRRYFLKHRGKNIKKWLMEQRQHKALELLHNGSSIKETAASLGYDYQTNFTRQYKCQMGKCPSHTSI